MSRGLDHISLADRAHGLRGANSGSGVLRVAQEAGLLVVLVAAMAGFGFLQPSFLSVGNVVGIVYQVSILGIMAVCSTFVVIAGLIDLSVGSVLALSGLCSAFVLAATGGNVPVALAAAVGVGLGVGLTNGLAVAWLGLPPIVVTLAMMTILRGVALLVGGGATHLIGGPDAFLFIGQGRVGGIPFPVILFVLAICVAVLIQRRSPLGLTLYAVGGNGEAARLSGLPVTRARTQAYLLSGLGAALAGVVLASQVKTASALYGTGAELDVIAAIVVGGTSLKGGSGSVRRSVTGALFIALINNGLTILNVSTNIQLVVKGVILIVALSLDARLKDFSTGPRSSGSGRRARAGLGS
jgi:ribose/xylose/arabinose/galactoside ABC-type transport system permease subunit